MVHTSIASLLRLCAAGALVTLLASASAAQAAVPKLGFYCGGKKDKQGICQLGVNVYKFKGKTLVTAATRIPSGEFTCRPSGKKGRGTFLNKVRLGEMPLRSTGSFSGKEKPLFGQPTLTISGKFTSATKVDVTFDKSFLPLGDRGDNCSVKKRINVSLKKQKTNRGLPF
jgi:hypothetical protein